MLPSRAWAYAVLSTGDEVDKGSCSRGSWMLWIACFRGKGFCSGGDEIISGELFFTELSGFICSTWLLTTTDPPESFFFFLPELLYFTNTKKSVSFFVGKRKNSSLLWGREINGRKSEKSSPFYIRNERESAIWTGFKQERELPGHWPPQLGFAAFCFIEASQCTSPAVCFLLKAQVFDFGGGVDSSKGLCTEHRFLRSSLPVRSSWQEANQSPATRLLLTSPDRAEGLCCSPGITGPTRCLLPSPY